MARVTVEDCTELVPNRFDLVMLAAQRARGLAAGAELAVERDDDKNGVVALREIAAGVLPLADLREDLVQGRRRNRVDDEPPDAEIQEALDEAQSVADRPPPGAQQDAFGPGALDDDDPEDVAGQMEREPGDVEGDPGDRVDQDVDDVGRAYGGGPSGDAPDALDPDASDRWQD
jgi:DNA-directed RNA polymerase subunit omega